MTERTPLPYLVGHATHEDPATAIELAIARIDGGGLTGASRGMLGLAYATEATGIRPPALADLLRRRLPDVHWVGAVAHGVYAGDVEYTDAPAVALMIVPLDPASWTLFSDDRQDDREMSGVLVHASPGTSDVEARIGQLRDGVDPGPLFGGITAATGPRGSHFAGAPVAGGCGMSGVAFGDSAGLLSAVTQGCAVLSSKHVISACSSNYIHSLDGSPALDVLLEDLGVPESTRRSRDGDEILRALPSRRLRRGLLLGIVDGDTSPLGRNEYRIRDIVGIDPVNRILAVATVPQEGDHAVFCTRDYDTARADLIRVCTELREAVETAGRQIEAIHVVSCVARGAHLFGAPGAELELIRHNLGDAPLIGFAAGGELADRHMYAYSGVLTLFTSPVSAA